MRGCEHENIDEEGAESKDESAVSKEPVVYDAYFGKPLTVKRQGFLANVLNSSALCTVLVEPCRKYEGRRVDGTCTNPKYPSRGARLSPLPRLLPSKFGPGNSLRPAKDGSELPSARLLRTSLLGDGFFADHDFSVLATHIFVFSFVDNVDLVYFRDPFQGNLLPGVFLTTMWFFREHNRIARELAITNPCWDDEKLFQTARKINIAQWQYIYYYELLAELLGRKNAVAEGVIYDTYGYVNDFEPHYEPGVLREYVVTNRWFHTFQPGLLDLYRNGKYYGSRTQVDDEFRSGYLALNNSEADITQGACIQPAEHFDLMITPDLAERLHGEWHRSADLPAIDIMRGRDAGLPPYNDYRQFCGRKRARTFDDLTDTIDKDKVEMLRRIYDDVDDVELMVAIYVERLQPGTFVPPTLYCIMVQNLLLWRKSDRFFFEHGDVPDAFSLEQLYEVKQANIARVLCDSGDSVSKIQPRAFLRKGPWNDFVSCNEIPGMDLHKWKDNMCSADITN